MARWLKLWTLAAALAATLGLAACGGDKGKTGGTVKVLGSAYPDFLDPALSFTADGWEALAQVYPGLLTFRHESGQDGADPVPGLAEDLPEISNENKTYKFKLREGLQFSDGTPVKASDVKASIERILALDSQGSSFYTSIVGAEEFVETKKGGLKGITAGDESGEITFELVSPRGTFLYELAIPFGGIVPKSTPVENQTKNPPPGTGRYKFSDVKVNRSYGLVKNDKFSEALEGTAVDAGKLDRIDVEIDRSAANEVTKVSQNKADFMIDNPAADRIAEIKKKYADRYREFPTNSTFFFFMNAEAAPFDKLQVRQAANYAIDPEAINRVQGGVLEPTHSVLPKGVPGFKETEDLYPGPDLDKARELIKDAGAEGAKVTVWGDSADPTKQTVEYYTDVLNDIGLKAKTKVISAETYFTTVGDRSVKAQTGYANWFQDYPHPADFIDVLLNPDNVTPTGNTNFTYNTKDRELAEKINALRAEAELTGDVKDRWAEIDREIQEKAYWAIFGSRKQSTFFSERMDFENCKGDEHPVWQHDWAQFCLKE